MYMYTVQDVVKRLEAEGITSSRQMVQRWLKEGKIEADKPLRRKDGYRVTEEAVERFINSWKEKHSKRTAAEYEAEIQKLKEELEHSHAENAQLRNELQRAEERNEVLTRDLFDALSKLESRQSAGRIIAAEQEQASKPMEPVFTEQFQFEKKKYEVRVYVREGKYAVHFFEGWGRFQRAIKIDKSTPLFKRFLEIIRSKHGVSVEMALSSREQFVPANEVDP